MSEIPNQKVEKGAPIFIMGIMPRSGTNFLHRLLCQHPDCGAINTTPVREDYVVYHGHWLRYYTKRLKWQWGHWGADSDFVAPLTSNLGEGISDFLGTLTEAKRFVTKTPSVSNIDSFFEFFPHARLLIIVRDGRSVVASGMSGFGWSFETASREWAKAAQNILSFKKGSKGFEDRFKIVQYESLNTQTVDTLREIFNFLGLEENLYDFDAALKTPVYGSSYLKEEGDKVSWTPKAKSEANVGKKRWDTWSAFEHQRFNRIAGTELKKFGYEPVDYRVSMIQACKHLAVDGRVRALQNTRLLINAVREGAKAFRKEWRGESRSKVDLKK